SMFLSSPQPLSSTLFPYTTLFRSDLAQSRSTMSQAAPEISFVIPCHNEQDNLRPLVAAIRAAVEPLSRTYEIVITDDCSTDNSRSEEHTSELQSRGHLVCRLLLEK